MPTYLSCLELQLRKLWWPRHHLSHLLCLTWWAIYMIIHLPQSYCSTTEFWRRIVRKTEESWGDPLYMDGGSGVSPFGRLRIHATDRKSLHVPYVHRVWIECCICAKLYTKRMRNFHLGSWARVFKICGTLDSVRLERHGLKGNWYSLGHAKTNTRKPMKTLTAPGM
jgi:hypothetical protein